MYDINKLKKLASRFNVEVSLYGDDQDKLQMIGTNGDINKFFEEAKRQGLLDKDPFDESYKVVDEKGNKVEQGGGFSSKKEAELFAAQYGQKGLKVVRESYDLADTSWIDDLIDTLRTYPSNDEIENDNFLKELRELYYKHYPNIDAEEGTLMERMDFDTLYRKIKYQEDLPIKEGLIGTLLFDSTFANELYDEFYRPLTDLIRAGDKEGALKEWQDLRDDFDQCQLDKKKWARTFVEVQEDRMAKYKAQIDALEDSKIEEPALVEGSITTATRTPKDTDYVIALKHPATGRYSFLGRNYRITSNLDIAMPYTSKFEAQDDIKYAEDAALETLESNDLFYSDRFIIVTVAEARKLQGIHETKSEYAQRIKEPINENKKEYKPHTKRLLRLIGSDKLDESTEEYSFDEYDDYEESYTPVSEDVDDEFEAPNYKAENVEFVMIEYISDSLGIESITKVNDTTYKVVYDGTEVEIVFDFGWDEWVYTINGKGPFAHSSYEWLVSDISNVVAEEPMRESYFEDEPSWLDDDDPVEADREHANLYGGDRTYCDICGSKLAMDEWGSYCPKCNEEEKSLNEEVDKLATNSRGDYLVRASSGHGWTVYNQSDVAIGGINTDDAEDNDEEAIRLFKINRLSEAFDTHSDIDLDIVGMRVANLLDAEALGDDQWIEFDCKESRGLIGTPDLHMSFEAIGNDKIVRGYMRAHTDGTIDVYVKNGSEGKFYSPEEIARFIAGEFGISL